MHGVVVLWAMSMKKKKKRGRICEGGRGFIASAKSACACVCASELSRVKQAIMQVACLKRKYEAELTMVSP